MSQNLTTGVILQIVSPSSESALSYLEGDELLNFRNIILKRIETLSPSSEDGSDDNGSDDQGSDDHGSDLNVSIWQFTDLTPPNEKRRRLDNSVFCPQIDGFLIFYDVKEPNVLKEWLAEGEQNARLRGLKPLIIGTYKQGESTKHFQKLFEGKSGIFLWEIGDAEGLSEIYSQVFELLF